MSTIGIEIGDLLRPHRAGMARYTECLVKALLPLAPEDTLGAWAKWRRIVGWHWKPRGIGLSFFGDKPPRARPDIFHATACVFPAWKSKVEIATAHDLFAVRPELKLAPDEVRRRTDYIQRADRVICVSHFTRRQVHELLDIPESRTLAIPLAAASNFVPASTEVQQRLRAKLRLPREFLLFVGRDRPNKNLDRLIEAYARAHLTLPLVIVGSQGQRTRQRLTQLARSSECRGEVRWLSSQRDADLPALLSCASALCMPSTFEGFGLPVIEAMACGTAVLTSAGRATEEAGGGKAILIDPESVESMADGLVKVLHMSNAQREEARAYATRRSWSDVAAETWRAYES